MAESSLSLGWPELKSEVGQFLGYGRTVANWDPGGGSDQATLVEAIVQSGIRRVYFPRAVEGVEPGYEWSFLRPSSTLYLGADGADGVVSSNTFTSATHSDWTTYGITAGTDTVNITAVGAGTTEIDDYAISVVSAGNITLVANDGTTLTFFVTRATANYDLPDDFSRLIGRLHYQADDRYLSIQIVQEDAILEMRSTNDLTGPPQYAAVRSKSSDMSTGQRSEIILYPRPDAAQVLTYSYEAYSGQLSDSYPYPLGGMHLSELYVESCLAVAEQRVNEEAGLHTGLFGSLLADAVARDRKKGAKNFGRMGNKAEYDEAYPRFRRGYVGGTYPITYEGEAV